MKKILVLGVDAVHQQVVLQEALGDKHSVKFVSSRQDAVVSCGRMDIIVIGLDHKDAVPIFFEKGFKGTIVPLLTCRKSGIVIGGKILESISIRDLPNKIREIFGQSEVLAT